MKTKGRKWFFVVAVLILLLTVTNIFGVNKRYGDVTTPVIRSMKDIRFGIDIRGGVDVSFGPSDGRVATQAEIDSAYAVVEQRLVSLSITDYELYKDVNKSRIILRFPWKVGEESFDPELAIEEIAATALLTFREGKEMDSTTGEPAGVTAENIIIQGNDIVSAQALFGKIDNVEQNFVSVTMTPEAQVRFAEASERISQDGGFISIWMDNTMISAPTVKSKLDTETISITSGQTNSDGRIGFTAIEAKQLADKINAGALPFALKAESYSKISPTLGSKSLYAMTVAGVVAFILIAAFMMFRYKLAGVVASISILGSVMGTIALISGYFAVFNSFTLTLPGIAGIILSIGLGVDANIITNERVKEELRSGKKLDNAISAAFERGLAPIIDSNITVLIVAAILMGAFGPTDGFFAKMLKPVFFFFGASTAGSIYSFGYTLLIGVFMNFIFGILCTRVMIRSLSKFKKLRKPTYYGGLPEGEAAKEAKIYNIVGSRKKFFIGSIVAMAAILVCSFVFGVGMDVQFAGGSIITYSYTGEFDNNEFNSLISQELGSAETQTGENAASGGKTITITVPGSETLSIEQVEDFNLKLTEKFGENNFNQLEANHVEPSIGREFLWKCIVALLVATILILAYVAFRFRKIGGWRGGLTAVIALLHDLLVVYGVFVIFRIPLSGNFVAVLLTILGYSINDTVVIYDRVRENRSLLGNKANFSDLVNLSINQSLTRSIYTTLTTISAIACVCIFSLVFGLTSILMFVFPLMLGMVSGVYSTICIAGPLWAYWDEKTGKAGVKKR